MNVRHYDLQQRTTLFAKRIRVFVKNLPRTYGNIEDIPQLIRSSGSIAANYIEANEALGKKDFLMRVRISLKESKESTLWLELCEIKEQSTEQERKELLSEAQQFVRIFSTMVRNAQQKLENLNSGS